MNWYRKVPRAKPAYHTEWCKGVWCGAPKLAIGYRQSRQVQLLKLVEAS